MQGLLHISDLSYDHVSAPEDKVTPGETVQCKIKSVNREQQRIQFSLKLMEVNLCCKCSVVNNVAFKLLLAAYLQKVTSHWFSLCTFNTTSGMMIWRPVQFLTSHMAFLQVSMCMMSLCAGFSISATKLCIGCLASALLVLPDCKDEYQQSHAVLIVHTGQV